MFAGMEPIAQIILTITLSVAVLLVLIVIIFRGIRVQSSKLNFNIDGKSTKKNSKEKKETLYYVFSVEDMESIIDILSSFLEHIYEVSDVICLQKKMDVVENRLSLLYDQKNEFFTDLLIKKKIPSSSISIHVDYLHYRQIIDRILYFDDGTANSIKSMLRKYLKEKSYTRDSVLSDVENKMKFERFISNVTDEVIQKTKRLWNDNYHTNVIDFDGKENKVRMISVEEIIEFEGSQKVVELLKSIFSEIFQYSMEIDIWIDKEKESIKDDRKKQIQMFLLKRKEKVL